MTATDALREAHTLLRRAVPGRRRQAHAEEGPLAASFRVAMEIWQKQQADGVPVVDRLAGLEKTLRAAWPQTREWKYLCRSCADYGLVMGLCPGDRTCGRDRAHLPHEVGTPCWCSRGAAFKPKQKPAAEDFAAAGKSKPTRIGR